MRPPLLTIALKQPDGIAACCSVGDFVISSGTAGPGCLFARPPSGLTFSMLAEAQRQNRQPVASMAEPQLGHEAFELRLNEAAEPVFEEPRGDRALVAGDKVVQALRNLVCNALKFIEPGEVCVSASFNTLTDTGAAAKQYRLIVAETGVGIAAENQELVLQEFIRVANLLQFCTESSGLGLPLSPRLAQLVARANGWQSAFSEAWDSSA